MHRRRIETAMTDDKIRLLGRSQDAETSLAEETGRADCAIEIARMWHERATSAERELVTLRKAVDEARAQLVLGYQDWDEGRDGKVGKRIGNACEILDKVRAKP